MNSKQDDRPWWKFWGSSEKQIQIQSDRQVLTELQFIVQKDLENFIGVLLQTCAVFELVNDQEDPLRRIHLNRLTSQLNLSRSIYYDTQLTSESNKTSSNLQQYKTKAKAILQQYLKQVNISDHQIEQLLNDYNQLLEKKQENLTLKPLLPSNNKEKQASEVQVQGYFDLLFPSMTKVDEEFERLRKGEYKQNDDFSEQSKRLNERCSLAREKIQIYLQKKTQAGKQ